MVLVRQPETEPLPGYRLIEPLGSGGFGEVWKCEAPGGLFKAVKFVYGNLNSLDVESARPEQELQALRRIKDVRNPFVLSMDRIEVVDGELLIVMELADESLHDRFSRCQAAGLVGIPPDALLRYVRDAAEALDHMLHKHQLQHLDVKPRNLFLVSDRVKVADFGLVNRLGRSEGTLSGATPLYAAPETLVGKVSEHSDQYSLAIVYQEMLTGQRPFAGKNARQLALHVLQGEAELRALPEVERPVVARALAKDPSQRFPNCLGFVRALYHARIGRPITLRAEPSTDDGEPQLATLAETLESVLLESPTDIGLAPTADAVSQLGITQHQPDTGVLRPTLIIGLGAFGRRALIELRCRLVDRFGCAEALPLHRFLYVDIDPAATRAAGRGAPEVALAPSEVYTLALQPMASYRRRMLEHLGEWLPREKLYAMPRSLQTQGSRALGRLAFADHHLRFVGRLRRELQEATHPDTLYRSATATGLAVRDARPRAYVVAAAGGGSSGMLADLGYALRRLLRVGGHSDSEVTAVIFCGAPDDPATPRLEQANVYATLTELHHFADPDIPFAARYGPDASDLRDPGPPFSAVYLIRTPHRTPDAVRDGLAHLGSYLFHELTTPLGRRLEAIRRAPTTPRTLFRSLGTFGIWFPRGLLLRAAARLAIRRLLQEWEAADGPTADAETEAACARTLADPALRFEAVCSRLEDAASAGAGGGAGAALTGLLSQLEVQAQQSTALDDPGGWSRQALVRVLELLGASNGLASGEDGHPGQLGRALQAAVTAQAQEWDHELTRTALALTEHPGRRFAAARTALARFSGACADAASQQHDRHEQQTERTRQAGANLQRALEQCDTGASGFSLFGGRSRRTLRVLVDHLAAYSRQRMTGDVLEAALRLFGTLQGRLDERARQLDFCRQRLRSLATMLPVSDSADIEAGNSRGGELTPTPSPVPSAEAYWDAIRRCSAARIVLPDGATDLDEAAGRFLTQLTSEQWSQLDQTLQEQVLGPLGGLHKACMMGNDLSRTLLTPLLAGAIACLGEFLPITDVAEVEAADAGIEAGAPDRAAAYYARAEPSMTGRESSLQQAFLLVPASEAGQAYGAQALHALPNLIPVSVPGQAHLLFCREQGGLTAGELQPILSACRPAYEQATIAPAHSPHARIDIMDWVPLDP